VSAAVAAGGWALAAVAIAVAVMGWRRQSGRMELIARACHELRGPLTAARLGLALGERPGALSGEQLRAIEFELGRATLALDDLSGSRSARPASEFDLGELLADSVGSWRADAHARGVELRLDRPAGALIVAGDRLRLAQATGNVIANALEHGSGDVVVRARASAGAVRVEFTDSGRGLPAPVASLARRRRHGRGERGRGLAIALGAAVAHGGRLAAAPTDHGARIVLELPLASADASSPAARY
jgi:signal transduction histidine kinase